MTIDTDISECENLFSLEIMKHVAEGGDVTSREVGTSHLQRIVTVHIDLNNFYEVRKRTI